VCCHKYIAQQPNTMAWATYTKLLVDPHRKSMKLWPSFDLNILSNYLSPVQNFT